MNRAVYKARIVPDHVPDGMVEKVIRLQDLGVPLEIALGRFEAAGDEDLRRVSEEILDEIFRRCADGC